MGGVQIPWDKGPRGHSDGDCLLHALTDALLGALGLGDIGRHFPDTDPAWKGVDSSVFLKKAREFILERGFHVENIDVNLHLERPKLGPYMDAMKDRIASLLGIERDRINLKAKGGEGLDAIGRGEAVAAQAVVLLCR